MAVLSKVHCTCPDERFMEKDEGLKRKSFVLLFSNIEPRRIEHLGRIVRHNCHICISTVYRNVSGLFFKKMKSVFIFVLGAKVFWRFDKIGSALLSKLHSPYTELFIRIVSKTKILQNPKDLNDSFRTVPKTSSTFLSNCFVRFQSFFEEKRTLLNKTNSFATFLLFGW